MKKFALVGTALTLVLSGCATAPRDIAPTYVSPMEYENLSCKQLGVEAQNLSSTAAAETGAQQKKADDDKVAMGVGLIVFWPAIFFRQGDGADAANLAQMKGRMQAIQSVSDEKHCGIQFSAS